MQRPISSRLTSTCFALIALAVGTTLHAAPPATCDTQDEPPVCPITKYLVLKVEEDPEGGDPCSSEECVPMAAALVPALFCDVSGDAVECLAGPLTAETEYPVSYRWKRSGGLIGAGSGWSAWTSNPNRTFRCSSPSNPVGTVTVAVRSPYNLESSTTRVISCPSVPY